MPKSDTLSFTIPDELKLKLDAMSKIGHYDSMAELLMDAIRKLLTEDKDLHISIAHHLYKEKKIP